MIPVFSKLLNWKVLTAIILICVVIAGSIDLSKSIELSIYCAFFFLFLTLIPANTIKWELPYWTPLARQLLVKRRDFGIASGFALLFHAVSALLESKQFSVEFFITQPVLEGSLAFLFFLILLFTSMKPVQRYLKAKWKIIHKLLWFVLPFGLVHGLSVLSDEGETSTLAIVSVVGLSVFLLVELVRNIFLKSVKPYYTHIVLFVLGSAAAYFFYLFTSR